MPPNQIDFEFAPDSAPTEPSPVDVNIAALDGVWNSLTSNLMPEFLSTGTVPTPYKKKFNKQKPNKAPVLEMNLPAKEANPWKKIESLEHYQNLRLEGYPMEYRIPYGGEEEEKFVHGAQEMAPLHKMTENIAKGHLWYNSKEIEYLTGWFSVEGGKIVTVIFTGMLSWSEVSAKLKVVKKVDGAQWRSFKTARDTDIDSYVY